MTFCLSANFLTFYYYWVQASSTLRWSLTRVVWAIFIQLSDEVSFIKWILVPVQLSLIFYFSISFRFISSSCLTVAESYICWSTMSITFTILCGKYDTFTFKLISIYSCKFSSFSCKNFELQYIRFCTMLSSLYSSRILLLQTLWHG